jgi:hypothetical protein
VAPGQTGTFAATGTRATTGARGLLGCRAGSILIELRTCGCIVNHCLRQHLWATCPSDSGRASATCRRSTGTSAAGQSTASCFG